MDTSLNMSAEEYKQDMQWVHRIKSLFKLLDYNKNGFVEKEDWELWVDNIEKACKHDPPSLINWLRDTTGAYFAAIGIKNGRRLSWLSCQIVLNENRHECCKKDIPGTKKGTPGLRSE